jgi:sorting nexin-29
VHHAYQIYVKLKNEEWNVYRRFAEFYEFHKQLQRNLQEVNDFQFPPKKVINRKTSQVIEERRLKLQDYLRFVIDLCSKPNVKRKDGRIENAIIYFGITKEQFLKVLPFFNDTIIPTNNPPTASAPSYNGL